MDKKEYLGKEPTGWVHKKKESWNIIQKPIVRNGNEKN